MKLLLETTNPTVVSFVEDLLAQNDIVAIVMHENISVVDGSIGIFPRRVMVIDEDFEKARAIVRASEAAHELAG